MVLGHNSHAICTDQLACSWFISSGQIEEVISRGTRLVFAHQVIILSLTDHLTPMGNCLHIVLILVARLIQGILEERQSEE